MNIFLGKMQKQILLRNLEKPLEKNLKSDIEWICHSFGFFEKIDREKTAASIFGGLLKAAKEGRMLSSTAIGGMSGITRGAALIHLKRMMSSGLVTSENSKYMLRCSSLQRTVKEVHRDIDRLFEDIEQIALEIDDQLGIKRR